MAGRVSYCFFCGTAGTAGGTCQSCLVPIGNPYAEGTAPVSLGCPRCATSRLTAIGIAPNTSVHACTQCHGVMVGARAWCTLLTRPDLAQQLMSRLPPRPASAEQLVRMLKCPQCAREMERGRFGASSNIVIDVCTTHGLWLDGGEIGAVVQHAQYRQQVGAHSARRQVDLAEMRSQPHLSASGSGPVVVVVSPEATRRRRGILGGLGVVAVVLLARFVFYAVMARGQQSPSQHVEQAGESAASAATALGQPH
ncbi:MAG: zf-TFIIB domain-containing protein [Deltaproteobacteria bacterium]|nr:zf-TFIIB domain-containing protein [Deltaproteobacteria bacterium]